MSKTRFEFCARMIGALVVGVCIGVWIANAMKIL